MRLKPSIYERLQDEDGGHPIDRSGALFNREISFAHQAIGLNGGEALIPEVDGQAELAAKFVGKGAHFFGLCAVFAGQPERKSDDDLRDIVVADDFGKLLEVGTLVAALERVDALGGNAEQVGDSHADTLVTDVEAEQAARLAGVYSFRS